MSFIFNFQSTNCISILTRATLIVPRLASSVLTEAVFLINRVQISRVTCRRVFPKGGSIGPIVVGIKL